MLQSLISPNAVQSFPMLGGDAGTTQTIAQIRNLVARGKKSIAVNRLAISIVWSTPQFSQTEKAQAIFDWVQQNTRFIPMIVGAQTLRSADEILNVRAGDCANLNAVLIPSLLETIGIRSRLVTVASDAEDPQEFTHVYAEAFVDGQWVPMDVARPGAAFGRAPETYFRKREWDLNPSGIPGLSGLLAFGRRGRGMGDDFSSLISALPGIESGGAQIAAAASGGPSYGVTYPPGTVGTVPPAGYSYNSAGQLVPTTTLSATGISGNTLLLIGGALVALMLLSRR
jgi:Transglutaminase-like superfamily